MTSVRMEGVGKTFGDVTVLSDLSLEIDDGELMAVLGPSGSGKTTLLRILAGLEEPDEGEVWLGDQLVFSSKRRVSIPAERRAVGMVFQSYANWPHMKVKQNIAFPLKIRKLPKETIAQEVADAIALVGLTGMAERYPAELSGGQQQRVAVARAICCAPNLLLLDEPLSNLDTDLRERTRAELRELQQRLNMTTMLVTHDRGEAFAISDCVAIMHNGRLAQVGAPRDVWTSPDSLVVADFLGWSLRISGHVVSSQCVESSIGRVQVREMPDACFGDEVTVVAPLTAVSCSATPPANEVNVFAARVLTATFLGERTDLLVELGGTTLTVSAPAEVDLAPDEECYLALAKDQAMALHTGEKHNDEARSVTV